MADSFSTRLDRRGCATVTLDRPELHNAFDDRLVAELTAELARLGSDRRVRAVFLAAAGRSFSAGADLGWMRRSAGYSREENLRDAQALAALMRTLHGLPQPTVALVQGAAYGGGVGLVACCDLAVATRRAAFCLSEVRLGLVPAVISPYVVAAIGPREARRWALTAEVFDAEEARRVGLVQEVVEGEAALAERAERLAANLVRNGPAALAAAKDLLRRVAGAPLDDALVAETAERIAAVRASPEGREGVAAFLEKRRPAWVEE
ncbi:MAG TPA: enoyl-CoA hydratase-related protein [Anaeromyxobacteraceae bacterium]|jgi:methylglutaconyl-CoA hydratase|nr:enoyl-CoA hydratase-related protein [Anaeromyxobacteraceae bacterium]